MRPFKHPRQPFTGMVLVAAAAILCADRVSANPFWMAAAVLAAAPILLWRPVSAGVWAFVGFAFFTLHLFNHALEPGGILAREFAEAPRVVSGEGIVAGEPDEKGALHGVAQSRFSLRLERLAVGGGERSPCRATVLVNWAGPVPRYGDRVAFTGSARNLPGPRNPGQLDFSGIMKRHGIYSEIRMRYANDGAILGGGNGSRLVEWAHASRRWMQEKLSLDLHDSPEIAGLVQGIVLGLRDQTPEETLELFQRTGTLHLFVVNGLHIGMFALIAQYLLQPFGVNRRRSAFVVIPLLVFYTLVTGLNPGSIRATIMAAVLLAGQWLERKPVSLNTLSAAAFAILAWDTGELFMPGFQFSFGVVLAIILLAGRFQRYFSRFGRPDSFLPRPLWSPIQNVRFFCFGHVAGLIGVSLAAWIGSTPFTARYFHLFSPGAVVANLVVVPAAFLVLAQGILALLAAGFSTFAAVLFNNANWAAAHGVLWMVRLFAEIPGGHFYVGLPQFHPPPCEITVFDFGAGGAVHLRAEHRDWLIDTGAAGNYANILRPYLWGRGVNRLDGLVLARGSAPGIGGAAMALADFAPLEVVDSAVPDRSRAHAELFRQLGRHGLGKGIYEPGDVLRAAPGATFRVLYPPPGFVSRVADDKSIVLQLEICGRRILFVSGAGFLTERWLLENEAGLRSDILVKGTHGSEISGTPDFLNAVRPAAVVCACAEFPESARIDPAWARGLAERGIALFRQDETGAVRIRVGREGYSLEAFLGGQTFRSNSR